MKKKLLFVLMVVMILICVGCSSTNSKNICDHVWVDASCTNGSYCEKCGEKRGEALGHQWEEASCEKAQTCSRCGSVQGEKLGHTTSWGKCKRCNMTVMDLVENMDKIEPEVVNACNYSNDAYQAAMDGANASKKNQDTYVTKVKEKCQKARKCYKQAAEYCEDYEGLKELKKAFLNAAEAYDIKSTKLTDVIVDLKNALAEQQEALEVYMKVIDKVN